MLYCNSFFQRFDVPVIVSLLFVVCLYGGSPLQSRAQLSANASTIEMACPEGFEPMVDLDGDCIDDVLESGGFWYRDNQLQGCDPSSSTDCYVTDPTAWSSDGDPYSDFQEATGVNMDNTVMAPYNNPLVAAMPRIEVVLENYQLTIKEQITDSNGASLSNQQTQTFSVESSVGISYTAGYEVSAGLDAGVTASSETTASFSVTAGYAASQTAGEEINWETATSIATDDAATLSLGIVARNAGSARALNVSPTFNLWIGDVRIGTITPSNALFDLEPGQISPVIVVDSKQVGGSDESISLSFEQLRQLQNGAPLKIEVIDLEAEISRWRPEDSNWTCGAGITCAWADFQSQIEARTLRLLVDFGYSGARSQTIPDAFTGNPFEYYVYTGSQKNNTQINLQKVLNDVGFDVIPGGNETLINGRPYPAAWFFISGPEKGGDENKDFKYYWEAAGAPSDMLSMLMPRGVSLVMASPDPEDAGPILGGHWFNASMNQLVVAATPKGSVPVEGGEAHVVYMDGRTEILPLSRIGDSGYFGLENPAPFPIAPVHAYVVMRDVLGNERTLGPGLTPSIPVAATCAETDPTYFDAPRWSEQNGTVALFVDGDLNKPVTAFCYNTSGGTDFWFPQVGAEENDMLGIALLDARWRVAVGHERILYSNNAGVSWSKVALTPEQTTTYRAVDFKKGTEVGIAVGDNGIFMRTEDGGATWALASVNTVEGEFHAVDHAAGDTWYAVGQNQVVRSTDDGVTWEKVLIQTVDEEGNTVENPGFENLTAVSFISGSTGVIGDHYMSDRRGRVYRTDDGGETWVHFYTLTELNDIAYDGAGAWYVVGRHVISRLHVNTDQGGGVIYSDISLNLPVLQAVSFPTPDVGYVVNIEGEVLQTQDGGETWSSPFGGYPIPSHPGDNTMRDIDMYDANIGGVVGTAGVLGATNSGGGVLQTVISTDIEDELLTELPQQITLAQNYPNPFNSTTTITYSLALGQQVQLEIFDLLGRRITTLVDGVQTAGMHQVRFDASNLSSGVYLYRLSTAEASEVQRMILFR